MPKCRLARARICLRLRAKSFFVASMTTKSLPVPCILVNGSFMASASIESGFPFWARLESLVQAEALLGHLQHSLLDVSQHAPRVCRVVAAREIVPLPADAHHIAVTGQ